MKAQKNSRLTTQILNRTIHLQQYLQDLKTMEIINGKHDSKKEYDLASVTNTSNKNIQNVEDTISHCNVMIEQLKQNMAEVVDPDENVLENVSLEKLEKECERIVRIIQDRCNQTSKIICEIHIIKKQAQKMTKIMYQT